MSEANDATQPRPARQTALTVILLVLIVGIAGVIAHQMGVRLPLSQGRTLEYPPILPGDPVAGEKLFFSAEVACGQCHRAGERGGVVGPNFTTLRAGLNRYSIERAILSPGKAFSDQHLEAVVVDQSGQVHSGITRKETGDPVELTTATGQVVTIPRSEVAEMNTKPVSSMPDNFADRLTVRQLADLCAFLLSRRPPEPATR